MKTLKQAIDEIDLEKMGLKYTYILSGENLSDQQLGWLDDDRCKHFDFDESEFWLVQGDTDTEPIAIDSIEDLDTVLKNTIIKEQEK